MIPVLQDHPWVVWPAMGGAALFTMIVLVGVWLLVRGFEAKVRAIVSEAHATLILTVTRMFNDADRSAADAKKVALTTHRALMDVEHRVALMDQRLSNVEEAIRAQPR